MFKLSANLKGHEQDVKSVTAIANGIVSVSRDGNVLVWNHEKDGSWSSFVNYHSDGFVNSVANLDGENIVFAGQDGIVNVTNAKSFGTTLKDPDFMFLGHEKNVCSLDCSSNQVISGSWDCTARVWEEHKEKYVLKGHKAAVWDAKIVEKDTYITASADKTVKYWNQDNCVKTFAGIHSDVIRSVLVYKKDAFFSASNDGTIKLVSMGSGAVLKTFSGHTSFVYQIKYLDENTLLSCGEDRSVRVWDISSAKCLQTLMVPCISVWTVAPLANGDIAVGGSDAMVRVFSKDSSRISDVLDSELKEEVEKSSVNMQQLDTSKIAGIEALSAPGKEGQTKMVKTPTGIVEAYQWSNSEWQKIGEVVGAGSNMTSSGKKQEYNGKSYDFVFDVDIEDGKPPLKLPYNLTDNPYGVAEKFVADNELPASYVQQVADFIVKNTEGVSFDVEGTNPYADNHSFTTFESFKKPLIMKGLHSYNEKADLSNKLSNSELEQVEKLLDNVPSNANKIYSIVSGVIDSDELVGYDLLRIIIKNMDYDEDLDGVLIKSLAVLEKPKVSNSDAAKLVMVGRCICNLLASKSSSKINRSVLSGDKLGIFYRTKIATNREIKESVKGKVKEVIDALQGNLG